ncbi:histidine kinase [uncultured Clostridium sp.]|uniref:sensor histidine kinase n=1 Tax=uncultured Clostridium sp. TaxID=59620 RepID=UPI0026346FC5|nr:histidine kinase [uncultured Clostridium sp.]
MNNKCFEIYSENILIRFFSIILMVILNLNENIDIFYIVTYLLILFILTLGQEMVKNKNLKMLYYFLAIVSAIIFFKIDYIIGVITIICLISEVIIEFKYGIILWITALIFFALYSVYIVAVENGLICLIVGILNIYVIKTIYKYRMLAKRENEKLEEIKEKFYRNMQEHNKYKDLSEQNIRMAKLEERNRIGREMHDKIGHVLAGSIMRLEASKIILNSDKEKGVSMMDESIENLREGMNDIREIIHKITPKRDEIGINRIKNELNEKFVNSGVKISFNTLGDLDKISFNKWIIFERIVMELSTNTLKYAECKNVVLSFEVLNKIIRFSFKDDGIGNMNLKKGFGLSKIEEEVMNNNGIMTINSLNGFQVIITLKIEE